MRRGMPIAKLTCDAGDKGEAPMARVHEGRVAENALVFAVILSEWTEVSYKTQCSRALDVQNFEAMSSTIMMEV